VVGPLKQLLVTLWWQLDGECSWPRTTAPSGPSDTGEGLLLLLLLLLPLNDGAAKPHDKCWLVGQPDCLAPLASLPGLPCRVARRTLKAAEPTSGAALVLVLGFRVNPEP
jgi:hypothetical protein